MPPGEQRGRLNQNREDRDNPGDYRAPSKRDGHSTRTPFVREDATDRWGRVSNARRGGALEQLFKVGLAAVGTVAAFKFLHKTPAGIEIAHGLGRATRFVGRGFNKLKIRALESQAAGDPAARALIEEMRETGTSYLGEIPRLARLRQAVEEVRLYNQTGRNMMQTDLGKALARSFDTKHTAPSGYTMLRAGEVLVGKGTRSIVGRAQQATINEALNLGIITKEMQLGRHYFRREGLDLMQGIRSTEAMSPRGIGSGIEKALSWIQVPFINWKLSSVITKPREILAPHRGIVRIPGKTTIGGTGKRTVFNDSYLVDGTLFAPSSSGYTEIASNLKPIFRSEHKDLMRIAGAMEGNVGDPSRFSRGPLEWMEKVLGVGPAYTTERSVLSSAVLDPMRRLSRGNPVLREKISRQATKRGTRQAMLDYFLQSGGKVPDDFGKVGNIYNSLDDMPGHTRFFDQIRAAFGKGKYTEYLQHGAAVSGTRPVNPGIGLPGESAYLLNRGQKWNMLANWLSMRPADLMSFTTGIAYKPGMGAHGWMKNMAKLFGIWEGAKLGVEAARYLDYQVEDLTGFSPMKGAASMYVGLRLGQKVLADSIGITGAAQYAEDLMPLSMSSTAGGIARTVGPGLIGGVLGGKVGLGIGIAASALMGGPANLLYPEDITKGAKEYYEELTGERKVPVRANRWWEFNAEEFSGGRIKYFKPHWYKEMLSDYEFTDVKYGDQSSYWQKVSPLPTPSNWFGLRRDRGWLGEVHAQDRPYPFIPGSGLNVAARAAFMDGGSNNEAIIGSPDDVQQRFSNLFEGATEFLGLYKFLGESILGIQAPFKKDVALASSEEMTSLHAGFWDSDFGGLFGLTELPRRFLLPRNAMPQSYNPLPNMMPNWLPGDRATFDADTRYFLNFHRGDPYRAVPHGEYRMPGPGYEAIHRMHSGQPGVYDAMDRYLILADVAPHSQSFRHYRAIVRSWEKAGALDESWLRKYYMTEEEVSAKKEGGRYTPRRFTGHDRTVESINESIKYFGFEKAIGGAWEIATHDVVPTIPFGSKFLRARTPYRAYLEEQVYGETFKNWAEPYESFLKPHMRQAIASDPLTGTERGAMLGIWGANPVSKLIFGATGAVIGGGGSLLRMMATGQMYGGWVPSDRETEWKHLEYMDRLEYVRAKRLQGIAIQEGNSAEALRWKNESERTMTGLPANASIGQMQAAMPSHLKKYFRGLIGAAPEMRGEIMGMLPDYIQPAFGGMWGTGTDQAAPEDVAADYFSTHELPADKWLGWHPNVPFGVSKIKMVDTANGSPSTRLHHYGLWESEVSNYSMIYNEMEAPTMRSRSILGFDSDAAHNLRRELHGIRDMERGVMPQTFMGFGTFNLEVTFNQVSRLQQYADSFLRAR